MHHHGSRHRVSTHSLSATVSQPRSGKLVLCIDDDIAGVEIRRLLLKQAGYEVATCYDGKTGLEIFAAMPIDLVVLDYEMLGLNGTEVAKAMRASKPRVPIIMLSGHPAPPQGVLEFADAYIVKGGSTEDLLSKILHLVDRL